MNKPVKIIRVRAPGRICLLGEHQDYLGLEVISGALNLGVCLEAEPIPIKNQLKICLLQTDEQIILNTLSPVRYSDHRDYLQSGLNVMIRSGLKFHQGWKITVIGDLPIGKGVSSSSALCVGWVRLLAAIADCPMNLSPIENARLAFQVEVLEFNEPGGMQDHIASALGGLLHMNFHGNPHEIPEITQLNPVPEGFLLVDSGETKNTLGMITRIKTTVEKQAGLQWQNPDTLLATRNVRELPEKQINNDPFGELRATLKNRDMVRHAVRNWTKTIETSGKILAALIRAHHQQLTHEIKSSSSAINRLITIAEKNGAAAGKVIGSGGGGCLLIYAPDNASYIGQILQKIGARVWKAEISRGVSIM
ncbi:hypothetical protein K8T06_07485 [bacterium]|nr:hypothetical protein [bacterium]